MHSHRFTRSDRTLRHLAAGLLALAGLTSPAAAHQLMNCGGPEYTGGPELEEGEEFHADQAFTDPDFPPYGYEGGTTGSFVDDVAGTDEDGLFQDYREGAAFSYRFETILGAMPPGKYHVKLFLAEPTATSAGERLYDVAVEGFKRIEGLDIFTEAGGQRTAVVVEMEDIVIVDGRIDVDFTGVVGNALVSAIVTDDHEEETADIGVHPPLSDVGDVELGEYRDKTVTIVNAGLETLTVSGLGTTSGEFTVVGPAVPFDVEPGATRSVTVRYAPAALGASAGDLEITSNDADEPVAAVPLAGEGVEPVAASAWRMDAGGLDYTDGSGDLFEADRVSVPGDFGYSGGLAATFSTPVSNTTDDLLYQTIRGGSFSYRFADLAPGDYSVALYFQEPFRTGPNQRKFDVKIEGAVVLDDYDIFAQAGGKNVARIETLAAVVADGQLDIDFVSVLGGNAIVCAVAVEAEAPAEPEPDVAVSPASVDFGEVLIGADAEALVTVTNAGTETLTVEGLATDSAVFSVVGPATPFDLLPGVSQDVTVRFTPDAVGPVAGLLEVTSTDPDEGFVTVDLAGTGDDGGGPAYEQRVNCAGLDYTDLGGDLFAADKAFTPGDWGYTGGVSQTFTAPVAGTDDDGLYQTVRGGASFTYTFDAIPDGAYEVTFYFQEPFRTGPGQRKLDVRVEGAVVLDDYDIFAQAGGKNVARNETVLVNVSDGKLDIQLQSVLGGNAIVGAIVVSGGE